MQIALVWWAEFGIYLLFFVLWKYLKDPKYNFMITKQDWGWFDYISFHLIINLIMFMSFFWVYVDDILSYIFPNRNKNESIRSTERFSAIMYHFLGYSGFYALILLSHTFVN